MKKTAKKQTILDTIQKEALTPEKPVSKASNDSTFKTPNKTNSTNQTKSASESSASQANKTLLKTIDESNTSESPNMVKTFIAAIVIVLAGTMTGFGLSQVVGSGSSAITTAPETGTGQINTETLAVGDVIGSGELENFPDDAEGVLAEGGIEGEGSHHLLRPGGPSQSVYLTSSIVDLDQLVGHKIKVHGDTFAAQKAGWLMDVGQVEILELDAPKPFEAE